MFVFLPPNTNSIVQPLYQRKLFVFKKKYRKKLNCFLTAPFKNTNKRVETALKNVNLFTVFNCFEKIIGEILKKQS